MPSKELVAELLSGVFARNRRGWVTSVFVKRTLTVVPGLSPRCPIFVGQLQWLLEWFPEPLSPCVMT